MRYTGVTAGSNVRFRLNDILCPDMEQVIANLTNRLQLSGRVVFLSDSGSIKDYYAVVEVDGLMSPVVVPVGKIEIPNLLYNEEYI